MKFLRLILRLSILLLGYSGILIVIMWPWAAVVVGIGLAAGLARKGVLTAYGTARWADVSDIPHLLEGGDQ